MLRGLATLAQLTAAGKTLPGVLIADSPRFAWRGLMIDAARHFISVPTILRTLDAMALVKLNVLHLHLTDDQAFRFGSRTFPELAQLGSDGSYFSEDDTRRHRQPRGGTRHPRRAGTRRARAHDELARGASGMGDGAGAAPAVERTSACMPRASIPTRDDVYVALGRLFDDVARRVPRPLRAHRRRRGESEVVARKRGGCRQYMRDARRSPISQRLQNLFNERLADLLIDRDRMLVGWDEIAHGDLPRTSVVQSWRGGPSRDRAVAQGFDCVFSAGYYLDFFYPADLHYAYDPESPAADLLARDELRARRSAPGARSRRARLGERIRRPERGGRAHRSVRRRAGCSAARRACGPNSSPTMCSRCACGGGCRRSRNGCGRRVRCATNPICICGSRYAAVARGVRRRRHRAAPAGRCLRGSASAARNSSALRDLFDAIEPIKWYSRLLGEAALRARVAGSTAVVERPYSVDTPLNRVVDYIDPASEWVPQFNGGGAGADRRFGGRRRQTAGRRGRDTVAPSARRRADGGRARSGDCGTRSDFAEAGRPCRRGRRGAARTRHGCAPCGARACEGSVGELLIAVVPVAR